MTATATGATSWKWVKDGKDLAGATGQGGSATFTKASVSAGDAGVYTAVFTNAGGDVSSRTATITIS